MHSSRVFTRRSLLAAAPLAATAWSTVNLFAKSGKQLPVGLELYSVRDELKKDVPGTLREVAGYGYQCVEFYSPYYDWAPDYAKQVKSQLDELGIKCYSTHNGPQSFKPEGIDKAIELNKILGAKYIVLASAGKTETADDWKKVADLLNTANQRMTKDGLHAGYHNHDAEWKPLDGGQKPLEIIAKSTDHSIMMQLDVGTCVATGNDPVAWIKKNPGRIRSLHLKEWSADKEYSALFGEGTSPWAKIFAAAESVGGAEYYLIEQEGSQYSQFETAKRCLAAYKQLRAVNT